MENEKLSDILGHDISIESLQQVVDFSAKLYYFMAKKMIEKLGKEEGSKAVEEAIIELGRYRGEKVREKVLTAGLDLTMQNEYKFHDLPIGTKLWNAVSKKEGGTQVSEIFHCPFGKVWKDMDAEEIGLLYCAIDYAIWEGYNPDIKFERKKCIFEGDTTCVMTYQEK
ncbi:MAG TPA: hypothetical protein DCG34_01745 [Clostridiales bacterium]|nr:hypothetical protein [Clostridiales bacterium]